MESEEKELSQEDLEKMDFWLVRIDETKGWNLPEEFKPYIKEVYCVYLFDRSAVTHICSAQKHYFGTALYTAFEPTAEWGELEDDARDSVTEKIEEMFNSESEATQSDYFDAGWIDQIVEKGDKKYTHKVELDMKHCLDETEAWVIEHLSEQYRGNIQL